MAASSPRSRRATCSRWEVCGADKQDAPTVLNESQPKRCRKMRLASAGRPKEHDIGTLIEPAVAGGKRHDLRLADHGHGAEVEGVKRLARRQLGAGEMPLDAAAGSLRPRRRTRWALATSFLRRPAA